MRERPCAAVSGVFNPDNLAAAKKRQNRITEYLRTKWEAIDREAWSLNLRSEAY
jgi:hypothetical protein